MSCRLGCVRNRKISGDPKPLKSWVCGGLTISMLCDSQVEEVVDIEDSQVHCVFGI